MKTHELCCIGHIILDKVVTPKRTVHMPGGTSYYFSQAICGFDDIRYLMVTAVGKIELGVIEQLRAKSIEIITKPSRYSVCFENIYEENQDNRTQKVSAKADPFRLEHFSDIEAGIYHLGTLLADDFPIEVFPYLAAKGLVAVDVQGYLREVRDEQVYLIDWDDKLQALPYIHFLQCNELEMEVLTGYTEVKKAAQQLYDWGVKEIIITLGSMGSVIYDGQTYHRIPAYTPKEIVDATGCGDTYMTGYLYQRAKGHSPQEAGRFAAAMSTLKIERSGPFQGTKKDVQTCMQTAEQHFPEI